MMSTGARMSSSTASTSNSMAARPGIKPATYAHVFSASHSITARQNLLLRPSAALPAEVMQSPQASVASAAAATAAAAVVYGGVQSYLETGSRPYDGNVGDEYDAWTTEGILEYYVRTPFTCMHVHACACV